MRSENGGPPKSSSSVVSGARSHIAADGLDSILDDALDDFEQQEMAAKIADMAATADIDGLSADADAERRAETEKMQNIMNQMNDPTFGRTLQATLTSLSSTSEGIGSVDNLFAELSRAYDTNLHSSVLPIDPNDPAAVATGDRQVGGYSHITIHIHSLTPTSSNISLVTPCCSMRGVQVQGTLQMLGQAQRGMEGFEVRWPSAVGITHPVELLLLV